VAVLLVVAAVAIGRGRTTGWQMTRTAARLRWVLLAIGIAEIVVAFVPLYTGPLAFTVAGIEVTTRGQDKPLAVRVHSSTPAPKAGPAALSGRHRFGDSKKNAATRHDRLLVIGVGELAHGEMHMLLYRLDADPGPPGYLRIGEFIDPVHQEDFPPPRRHGVNDGHDAPQALGAHQRAFRIGRQVHSPLP